MFTPRLASTATVQHPARFVFTFTGTGGLLEHPAQVPQVWTNFPAGDWHALDFEQCSAHGEISLAHASHSSHTHEARVFFSALHLPVYSFTYRILDTRDGSIRWLGDQHSNGTLLRPHHQSPFVFESTGWADDPHFLGARAWVGQLPSLVARFGGPSDLHAAYGFAITADDAIVRFRLAADNGIEFEGGAGSSAILPTIHATPLAAQLVALALFPEHDLPVLVTGDDLRLTVEPYADAEAETHASASNGNVRRSALTLHARSRVTLRRDFDASVVRACVKPLRGLSLLETQSEHFCAVLSTSGSARMITVLPTSYRAPSQSTVRVHGLDAVAPAPCAFYCSGSQRAYFHSHVDSALDILTPAEGGDIVIGIVHETKNGSLVAVLQPALVTLSGSSPTTPSAAAPVINQRALAFRRGLLSLPALCAIAWFLITTLLRCLPQLAPVRFALALSERSEHFLNDRVFGLGRSASTPTPTANGKTISQQHENGIPAPGNEIDLAFPSHGKKTNLVTLLVRSAEPGAALPVLYFGTVRATIVAQTALEPDGSMTLLQLERSVNAPVLRVVF